MKRLLNAPRLFGLVCAVCAVMMGLAYMAAAGAPARYLSLNVAALTLGAGAWLGLGPTAGSWLARNGQAILALSLPLIATALLGAPVDGAARWVSVGPLSVQVSLVLLPTMIVLYARGADALGTAGIAVAALALALQPDRGMAAALAAAMATLLLTRPGRLPALAFAAAASAFAATLLRPDALPAVPFVDRILYTAFTVHAAAGLAVLFGSLILLAPALPGALRRERARPALLAFGTCWAAVVAAAALGNYPTPLVGYGGSAVLGYLLSVALLPASPRDTSTAPLPATGTVTDESRESAALELSALAGR